MGLNVALIGFGYWGRNILRNLVDLYDQSKIFVAEKADTKRSQLNNMYPGITTYASIELIYQLHNIDAVVIATETKTHYILAKQALELGKHVFVEKPMTTSVEEAENLAELAKKKELVLMVDHIFLYHAVVRKMKDYFTNDFLGKVNYIDATRINLGIYQRDINVLWDLACHDISIVNHLVQEQPESVQAIGRRNIDFGVEDLAYLFLYYKSGLLVQINSSWASPVKIRKIIIGGEKRMMIYDDIEPTNKLIIYDYAFTTPEDDSKLPLTEYRLGNITIPRYEQVEPLRAALSDFFECIKQDKQPTTNARNAIDVIRILEKAQESLQLQGKKLSIN